LVWGGRADATKGAGKEILFNATPAGRRPSRERAPASPGI
jgi:hypothetical protein